jgi:CHAT domain-containing protein
MRCAIVLGCLLLGPLAPTQGQPVPLEQPKKLAGAPTAAQRKQLVERARALSQEVNRRYFAQQLPQAEESSRQLVALFRELYPAGHPDLANSLNNLALILQGQGRPAAAEPLYREALTMYKRLYPEAEFPAGHPLLAGGLHNLAGVLEAQGRASEAEPYYRDALAMFKRVYPEDRYPDGHDSIARSLSGLALLLFVQGRPVAAEPYCREGLAMRRRLYPEDRYPDGHPGLVGGLDTLGAVLRAQGRPAEAERLCRESLAMVKRLYPAEKYPKGHTALAIGLSNLAVLLLDQGKPTEAAILHREALAMYKRLFPEAEYPAGHPLLADGLHNLAFVLLARGRPVEAEPVLREALAMQRRLYPPDRYGGGHPSLARGLNRLAFVLLAQGRPVEAEPFYREALAMRRWLAQEYALGRSEGDTLNFLGTFESNLDGYFSATAGPDTSPAAAYAAAWQAKAAASRVFERRHLAARAATASPRARKCWDELSSLRRLRAELVLAPQPGNPNARRARDRQLEAWARRLDALLAELRRALPELARARDLRARTPADLQKALPPHAAFVDFFRYTRFKFDPAKPGRAGVKRTESYVAFVVTPRAVARVELGPAAPIDKHLMAWRKAIEGGPGKAPADLPRALRQQLWDKVAAHLPAGPRTIYLAPDQQLAFLPFGALPGEQPGTVLLEDCALAVVPSGPFLLDRLTAPGRAGGPKGLLAVGAVAYDRAPAEALPAEAVALRGPAAGEGKPLTWKKLLGTERELTAVRRLAEGAKVPAAALAGAEPSAARLLAELPKCGYAHLATHGFFAGPEFRRRIQADEGLFFVSGRERVGEGALSPFLLSGVVCAGANLKETPGGGLLTAEALVNADLSGMELAVLSACDTGLGEVGGGEGVLGLQRAFHVAGCRNVVASLWKVEDEATAALMGLFYRNLWEKKRAPLEALRQAQLALYYHPELVAGLARGEPRAFERVQLPAKAGRPAGPGARRAPVRQWAAFVLSGSGR